MTTIRHRLASLDVLRGLAIAGMIVVNNPGNWSAVARPLMHAPWNGWTFADTIFPCFIVIVGATLPFAFARRGERATRQMMLVHVATRSAVLIAIGLALNLVDALPHAGVVRVPGVLQRIGLAYALAAPIVLMGNAAVWIGAAIVLLVIHTVLLLAVPFGGQPAGTLTVAHNLPGFVDAALFGRHMLAATFDPEGLVGTLSTAATLLCGALAGAWCRDTADPVRRTAGLIGGGALALAAGLSWSHWLPLNKTLWTGSYALASAGVAVLVFAVCFVIVDVFDQRAWARPFIWLGVNPLAIYCLSEFTRHVADVGWVGTGASLVGTKDALYWRYLVPLVGDAGGVRSSLLFAITLTALWTAVAGALYRRGVRFRA